MKTTPKTHALDAFKLLKVLEEQTDVNWPQRRSDLIEAYEEKYGETLSVSTFDRYIQSLNDFGIEIVHEKRLGYYLLTRAWENSEIYLLLLSVASNPNLTKAQSDALTQKIRELGGAMVRSRNIKTMPLMEAPRAEAGTEFLYQLESVRTAIARSKKITFTPCRLAGAGKLVEDPAVTLSPYTVMVKGQQFYVIGYWEEAGEIKPFRIDKMNHVTVTEQVYTPLHRVIGFDMELDYNYLYSSLPFSTHAEPEAFTLIIEASVLDELCETFGTNGKIQVFADRSEPSRVRVLLTANPEAVMDFALRHLNAVEIKEPAEVRERVREIVQAAAERYGVE